MSEDLRTALRELGERMPAARLASDPWLVGRRQRRRAARRTGVAALVAVLVSVLGVAAALGGSGAGTMPAAAGEGVPERISLPWMWQATVEQDPPGPASVLFGGGGLGLRGSDFVDHEGKIAVVGRGGDYRMLLYGGTESSAGDDVQLSPDGRYVADGTLGPPWLTVTDLTDGSRRGFSGPTKDSEGTPVAWSRDGASLLVLEYGYEPRRSDADGQAARLTLLELATGATRTLLDDLGDRWKLRTASVAAFSPDGSRIAATAGDRLSLLDRDGRTLWSRDLGPRRKLAGSGAFTADGSRIAVADLDGCLSGCDSAALAARTWTVTWLDAATGQDVAGPTLTPVRGQALRALGWRLGTDLVAVRYEADPGNGMREGDYWNDTGYWESGRVQLIALRPDGATEVLLDPPDEVWSLDVARDLLEAGAFGAPATEPRPFPARPIILLVAVPLALPVVIVVGVLLLWRRHRRWLRMIRSTPPMTDPPWPT
ncbi:hypothetical protein C1I95_05205 [Micromonospora craterilacus]|uniref:WD40 repeat domain-containing protein n=1 Tax=Micromonospora craterilacus TaxID=1655439 RepID=A0A2W2FCR1_9ACTN|nr:hypothetical protein [Micromonospora craterilacus]PZG22568.1 hypothetical protein C1I95_05205 [Micromonospora craterilacus]